MNIRKLTKGSGAVSAFFLALVPLFCPTAPAFAGGSGSAGMQVLKSDFSPRAAGMGGAFVAVADDIYTMDYNPAGLGQLYIPEASAMYLSGFDDSTLNHISMGLPLPFIGLAGLSKPGLGLSLMMSDAGSFNYRRIMGDGSVISRSYDAQKDFVFAVGYGEKVYSDEVNLEGYKAKIEQYLGLNVKFIKSTMLENYSASAPAFDGGWLITERKLGLSLGASLANYSSGLKYGTELTKLPSILRVGAAFQRPTVMDQSILFAAEGDFYMAEARKSIRLGLEYHFEQIFNLRVGYKAAEDNNGLTMGLGLHYNDMSLDYASALSSEVYNPTQLSFSYKFSGITIKEYRKKIAYKDPEPQRKEQQRNGQPKPQRRAAAAQEKKKDSDFLWLYDTGPGAGAGNRGQRAEDSSRPDDRSSRQEYSGSRNEPEERARTARGQGGQVPAYEMGAGLAYSIPMGTAGDFFDGALGFNLYYDLRVADTVTLGGEYGYFSYDAKQNLDLGDGTSVKGLGVVQDYWSLRVKFVKMLEENKVYGIVGVGVYGTAGRSSTSGTGSGLSDIGLNFGGGYTIQLTPHCTAGVEVRYHVVKDFNTIAPGLKIAYSF